MAVCKFYAQGRCKNGDSCRFEHPGSGRPRDDSNSFAALNQGGGRFNNNNSNSNNNRPAAPSRGDNYRAGSNQPLPFLISKEALQLDLTTEKPQWPFSSYGPGRDAPRELLVDLEFSMEEMRLQYYLDTQAAIQNEQQLLQLSTANVTRVLQRLDEAVEYVIAGKDEHPNRLDMCQGPGAGSQPPPKAFFGAAAQPIAAPSGSSFGQPSSVGANAPKPAFGAPAFGGPSQPGGFGQPSALGQSGGFGQPSTIGQASAFGQPSAINQGSAFGQPSAPGQGSAFGQPSAPGTGSTFGQPSVAGAQPAFGQASAPASAAAGGFGHPSGLGQSGGFGQPSPMGQTSGFGQPSAVGQNAGFGQPSAMGQNTGFGQASALGQNSTFGKPAFGQSSFGQPANIGRQASSFAQAGGAPGNASPFAAAGSSQQTGGFGQASTMGNTQQASPFGQPPASASQPAFGQPTVRNTPSAFGQPATPAAQNAFGQPSAPTTQNGFGQASAFGQAPAPASRNAFGQPAASATQSAFGQASTAGAPAQGQQSQGNPFGSQPASTQPTANPFGQPRNQLNQSRPALPQSKAGQHVFFPNGPPNRNPDIEDKPEAYNEILQAAYTFLAETGTFKDGIMPEVPPKSEWIRFDV